MPPPNNPQNEDSYTNPSGQIFVYLDGSAGDVPGWYDFNTLDDAGSVPIPTGQVDTFGGAEAQTDAPSAGGGTGGGGPSWQQAGEVGSQGQPPWWKQWMGKYPPDLKNDRGKVIGPDWNKVREWAKLYDPQLQERPKVTEPELAAPEYKQDINPVTNEPQYWKRVERGGPWVLIEPKKDPQLQLKVEGGREFYLSGDQWRLLDKLETKAPKMPSSMEEYITQLILSDDPARLDYAMALDDWRHRPSQLQLFEAAMQRAQMVMDIAQSPVDYFVLDAMRHGLYDATSGPPPRAFNQVDSWFNELGLSLAGVDTASLTQRVQEAQENLRIAQEETELAKSETEMVKKGETAPDATVTPKSIPSGTGVPEIDSYLAAAKKGFVQPDQVRTTSGPLPQEALADPGALAARYGTGIFQAATDFVPPASVQKGSFAISDATGRSAAASPVGAPPGAGSFFGTGATSLQLPTTDQTATTDSSSVGNGPPLATAFDTDAMAQWERAKRSALYNAKTDQVGRKYIDGPNGPVFQEDWNSYFESIRPGRRVSTTPTITTPSPAEAQLASVRRQTEGFVRPEDVYGTPSVRRTIGGEGPAGPLKSLLPQFGFTPIDQGTFAQLSPTGQAAVTAATRLKGIPDEEFAFDRAMHTIGGFGQPRRRIRFAAAA